ncbi:hypothetical protein RRG08_024703 [Elysia crispata]|uniref:Uncharacterized protein n=1 Tax=Elysia crispata TaxID=231223 RepID=A0AAE0YDR4_9GAST|nr:hypothetical protein RRG08_024703 [Elysia crispata]
MSIPCVANALVIRHFPNKPTKFTRRSQKPIKAIKITQTFCATVKTFSSPIGRQPMPVLGADTTTTRGATTTSTTETTTTAPQRRRYHDNIPFWL